MADIKKSLMFAIADMKAELRDLSSRIGNTEDLLSALGAKARATETTLTDHFEALRDLNH